MSPLKPPVGLVLWRPILIGSGVRAPPVSASVASITPFTHISKRFRVRLRRTATMCQTVVERAVVEIGPPRPLPSV